MKMTSVEEIYTLTISGVVEKMTGNYRCVATNSKGTATYSAMVTITDGKKPEEKKPEEKKPEEKKPEEKKPEEKKAEPQQEKDEEVIVPVIEEKAETAPPLAVDTGAPKFVEVYEEQSLIIKQTLTLKAKITGKPAPTVEWFR